MKTKRSTNHSTLFRPRDYQFSAWNRTCSIRYRNLVPEKIGTRL